MKPGRIISRTSDVSNTSSAPDAVHSPSRTELKIDPVWWGRFSFILCLFIVAAVLGFLAFHILSLAERNLAENQFNAIAERALFAAKQITERKRVGSITMASTIAHIHSNANAWPFVMCPGYEDISSNIIAASSGQSMGFLPIVRADERQDFENFAYNHFEEIMNFPNGTGESSFGKGIWAIDPFLGTSDNRYHDTDPSTTWGSPYEIFAPLVQHNTGPNLVLMFNLHEEEARGRVMDGIIECVINEGQLHVENMCGGITDVVVLRGTDAREEPSAIIIQPIFPAQNKTILTGFIPTTMTWSTMLEGVFDEEVRGIDCVLATEMQRHTYTVLDGEVIWEGDGDFHEPEYNAFEQSILLTEPGSYSNVSASYTLHIYPSQEFYDVYSTKNPRTAAIGAVGAIVITSLMFFLYDLYVRRDIKSKKELLEAKRAFVRFVSHEVRTPLNSVVMGLTLMQEEMAMALGFNTVEALTKDSAIKRHTKIPENAERGEELIHCFRLSEEVHENALRSVDVLNDLLNYDKIEMGNLKLELVVIPIQQLVERTAAEFQGPASQKKIELNIDFSRVDEDLRSATIAGVALPQNSSECRAVGDDIRIAQVVRNLLSNAIKFTPEGGEIHVKASWKLPNVKDLAHLSHDNKFVLKRGEEITVPGCGFLTVSVVDSGVGMKPDQISTVFVDGVQFNANELQKGNGTGLGLHIAKGIMELHDGELSASSKGIGTGTTFSLELPLYHVPDVEEKKSIENPTLSVTVTTADSEPSRPQKVLVVDDAAMNRKLLVRILRNRQHDCDEADDGDVAVEMVRKSLTDGEHYDTILLDHEMPKLSGPDAAKQMRAMGSDVFIVGVTGNLLPDDVDYFKQCGANAVLAKPFKLSALEELWYEHGILRH